MLLPRKVFSREFLERFNERTLTKKELKQFYFEKVHWIVQYKNYEAPKHLIDLFIQSKIQYDWVELTKKYCEVSMDGDVFGFIPNVSHAGFLLIKEACKEQYEYAGECFCPDFYDDKEKIKAEYRAEFRVDEQRHLKHFEEFYKEWKASTHRELDY